MMQTLIGVICSPCVYLWSSCSREGNRWDNKSQKARCIERAKIRNRRAERALKPQGTGCKMCREQKEPKS
jgi:hypothetical protein